MMKSDYKPKGYTSVAPYLMVDDARKTIAFLERVFDATIVRHVPSEQEGKTMHGEVRIDDTVIMLSDMGGAVSNQHIHVYVEDVDTIYGRAIEAGATSVQEPVKKEDADRRSGVRGPGGVTWWIATQIDPE